MLYLKTVKTLSTAIQLLILPILLLTSTQANANSPSLGDALTASLDKANQSSTDYNRIQTESYQSSSWLASFPTVSLNYLDSQDISGANEQEISLNLPLKSPFLRTATEKLSQLNQESKQIRIQKNQLYFSGLLRETLWRNRFAEVELVQANKKRALLEKLCEEYRSLFDAREVEHYALLLIEQELSSQNLKISNMLQQQQQWQQRYFNITGLQQLPQQIVESPILNIDFQLSEHPFIRALDNGWEQQQIAFNSQGNGENEPWTVSLTTKTINNGLFEEKQIGINFEIPLTFSKFHRQIDINTQTNANTNYYAAVDRMRVELSSQWSSLLSQQQNIQQQQKLLVNNAKLSQQIARQLVSLHNEGEISHETWLRRYLLTIDSQTALAIGNLKKQQIHSMLKQAAGIPL